MKWKFNDNPAAWVAVLQAILNVFVIFIPSITPPAQGAIAVVLNLLGGLVVRQNSTPSNPSAPPAP